MSVDFLEDSRGRIKVKKNVKDSNLTLGSHAAWSEALNSLLDLIDLRFLNFFFHGWTTDAISIDDDLVRESSFVSLSILLEGFQNEDLKNVCSSNRGFLLLDLF